MRVVSLDGNRLTSEAAFWQEYLAEVRPEGAEYFGRNLAAFRDAVAGGGPGWPGSPCRIRIVNARAAGLSPHFLTLLAEIVSESDSLELELA